MILEVFVSILSNSRTNLFFQEDMKIETIFQKYFAQRQKKNCFYPAKEKLIDAKHHVYIDQEVNQIPKPV